ncbi:MAG: hypothetical protein HY304_07240 [candidate division Zixibacteria bacterium]|nr:hypothetical protein [candidate division Zixibacteria bacterium]
MHAPISQAARPTALPRQRIAELRVQCSQQPESVPLHKAVVGEFLNTGPTQEALPLLRRLANVCADDVTIKCTFKNTS